jgi:hypothetical protein
VGERAGGRRETVQAHVSHLRGAGRWWIVTQGGPNTGVAPEQVDAVRFEALGARRRRWMAMRPPPKQRLCSALGQRRGAAAEFAYEPFAQAAIARLQEAQRVEDRSRLIWRWEPLTRSARSSR